MSENPRQFSSLDYADADMYAAIAERPSTATPLEKARPVTQTGRENASERTMEKRLWQEEWQRTEPERTARKNAEAAREQEITRRTQSQRQELANRIPSDAQQPPKLESPASQPPRSTPERQPTPSTGSPPPTSKGTALRASPLVEPTATPAPAMLKEAAAQAAGGLQGLLPRSLPQAAGRYAIPAAAGALTLASRLIAGEPVSQAVAGTAGTLIGSGVGLVVGTALGGPIGGVIGSMIGGFAGGYISDAFFNQQLPATGSTPDYAPSYSPFLGGQVDGVTYTVKCGFDVFNKATPRVRQANADGTILYVRGPIRSITLVNGHPTISPGLVVIGTKADGGLDIQTSGYGSNSNTQVDNLRNIVVTGGNPATDSANSISTPAPPPSNDPYRYDTSPIGNDNTVPSGRPAAGANKGKDKQVAPSMPSNNTPNGAPFFPGHAGLGPNNRPNPTQYDQGLPGLMPKMQPQRQPLPFAEPDDLPLPRAFSLSGTSGESVPSSGNTIAPALFPESTVPLDSQGNVIGTDVNGNIPEGFKPNPLIPNPLTPFAFQPRGIPETSASAPVPDALSPTPKADSVPKPETPADTSQRKQAEDNEATKKAIEEQIARLTGIATAIAALTPAIRGIPDAIANSPNVRAANKETTQGAVCEISQPTGCLGAPIKQAEDAAKANGNKLDEINAALGAGNAGANAALLAGQQTILERLGDQLPGGIGGKLSRFADWMHLDRVLNILILATTIHNGLMLSNDIGQTLLGAINNLLTLIGLKKEDGSGFDLGSVISGSIENLIKGAIGADNYTELKEAWAKANRIYQATTNVLNSFLNLSQTILQASELIAAYTGKIGNALKKGGVILENAYGWMNPQPKFNRVTQTLESLQNGASTIQMVTQAPLDVVNAVTESTTAATEFVKAVKEDDKPVNKATPIPEPDELKAKESQSKTDSQPFSFDFSDLFDGED